jgi:hypothetical protein
MNTSVTPPLLFVLVVDVMVVTPFFVVVVDVIDDGAERYCASVVRFADQTSSNL